MATRLLQTPIWRSVISRGALVIILRPCCARALSIAGTSAQRVMQDAPLAALSNLKKFDIGLEANAASEAAGGEAEMFEDPREAILNAALAHVQREGWSMEALAAGANDLGYPSVASGMFDKGAVELVWHVVQKANLHVSQTLESKDLASIPVNERVKAGVQARLTYLARYKQSWAQAMALGLQPAALAETLQLLAVASDEIWYWAGDRSTDLNWYTRRLLLMGVIASTETAMLGDRTVGEVETWEFLDRRLHEVSHFGRSVGDGLSAFTGAGGALGSIFNAGFELIRPFIVRESDASSSSAACAGPVRCGSQAGQGSSGGSPPPGAEGLAGAAAAASSLAQAVATQAAAVAAAAGVRISDPTAVISALSSLLPRPDPQSRDKAMPRHVAGNERRTATPAPAIDAPTGPGTNKQA